MTEADNKKNLTQNLTEAINKLQGAKDDLKRRFDEAKTAAPEDTSDLTVALQQAAELIGEGTAKVKAAYEEAGGIKGISETATKKAAEVSATAKVVAENVSDSDAYKSAIEAAKSGAQKASETKFFKDLKEHVLHLTQIAKDTYHETYDKQKTTSAPESSVDSAPIN